MSELGMITPCPCGSGEPQRDLIDARGIFYAFVCDACEKEKRKAFPPCSSSSTGLTNRSRRTNPALYGFAQLVCVVLKGIGRYRTRVVLLLE